MLRVTHGVVLLGSPHDDEVVNRFDRMVFDFIWGKYAESSNPSRSTTSSVSNRSSTSPNVSCNWVPPGGRPPMQLRLPLDPPDTDLLRLPTPAPRCAPVRGREPRLQRAAVALRLSRALLPVPHGDRDRPGLGDRSAHGPDARTRRDASLRRRGGGRPGRRVPGRREPGERPAPRVHGRNGSRPDRTAAAAQGEQPAGGGRRESSSRRWRTPIRAASGFGSHATAQSSSKCPGVGRPAPRRWRTSGGRPTT